MIFINNRFKKVKPYTFFSDMIQKTLFCIILIILNFIRAQNKYSIPKKTMRINKIRKYALHFLFHNYSGTYSFAKIKVHLNFTNISEHILTHV